MGGRGRGRKRARPPIRIQTSGASSELTNSAVHDSRVVEAAPRDYPDLPEERRARPLPPTPEDRYAARVEERVSSSIRFSGYHQSKYRMPQVERYGDRERREEGRKQVLDEPFKLVTMFYPPELVDVRRAADRAKAADRERRRLLLSAEDALDDGLDVEFRGGGLDDDDEEEEEDDEDEIRKLRRRRANRDVDEFYAEDANNDDQDDEDDGDYAAHGDMDDDEDGDGGDEL